MAERLTADAEEQHGADASPEVDDLRAASMEMLDFHTIRQQVADRTTFSLARQLALRLTPSYSGGEVEELHRQTAEGRALMDQAGELSLQISSDPSAAVTRAALGGVLTGMELLAVADSVEAQRHARAVVLRARQKAPLLAAIAEGFPDLQELQKEIRRRIGVRGEVVDDATPNLRALRHEVRQAYERVTQALTRIIQSSVGREALQDQVISIRGDRLVVQVKAEMRSRVPGVVHDASNTGATLFVEPFTTVELCNGWRELALEEEREVGRVLRDLSALVGSRAEELRRGAELMARLDFILARARYSAAIGGASAMPPQARYSAERPPQGLDMSLCLLNARHPLLGEAAVPINVHVGPGWSALVITGPNTGGKTVAMKTVGLLALMHQSGLHIPAAEGSVLPVFDGIYADVGDQQSIEESVSTFSSHMRSVVSILARAGAASLVLLDELGSSTGPEEGAALAKAILSHLASRAITTIATTHHRTVAAYAQATPGMMNASVQLDPSSLRPTYHLTMGVPGRSYAMAVASHMGLSQEIMDTAQSLLEPQYQRFEDWLNELQDERRQLQVKQEEAERARAQAEALRRELEGQIEYLVAHREDIVDSVRRETLAQHEEVRRRLRRAEAALSWNAPSVVPQGPGAEVSVVRREVEAQRIPGRAQRRRVEPRPIAVGDQVHVRGLNLRGTVALLLDQEREAEVNVGKVRLRMDIGRLTRVDELPEAAPVDVHVELGPSLLSMELDLRGLRADEALARLEEFLDRAVRDGLSSVRIIHGRGTGALRQAVRDHLSRHRLVRAFSPEVPEGGGNGATAVELA